MALHLKLVTTVMVENAPKGVEKSPTLASTGVDNYYSFTRNWIAMMERVLAKQRALEVVMERLCQPI